MSAAIEVDHDACVFGWGPCGCHWGAAHECKRGDGHRGRHVCRVCGVTTAALPQEQTGENE